MKTVDSIRPYLAAPGDHVTEKIRAMESTAGTLRTLRTASPARIIRRMRWIRRSARPSVMSIDASIRDGLIPD